VGEFVGAVRSRKVLGHVEPRSARQAEGGGDADRPPDRRGTGGPSPRPTTPQCRSTQIGEDQAISPSTRKARM
jgi:hypothetical protein